MRTSSKIRSAWHLSSIRLDYHDYARSAEAALAATSQRNSLLGRMRILDIADAFNSNDVLAVDTD